MSLAEDLRKPFMTPEPRDWAPKPARRSPADHARLVASAVSELRGQSGTATDDGSADTLGLLERASKTVVFVLNRCRQLEEHVGKLDAWSKSQVQAAEAAAARWQQAAADSERRMQEVQQQFDAIVRRAEAAERELKCDKETLSVLESRITTAFGFGSEAYDALSMIEID